MALGVTFPENEYVFAFGRKNEVLVLLVSKLGIYKRIGQLCWILAEKSVLKELYYRGMQISRNALTHCQSNVKNGKTEVSPLKFIP